MKSKLLEPLPKQMPFIKNVSVSCQRSFDKIGITPAHAKISPTISVPSHNHALSCWTQHKMTEAMSKTSPIKHSVNAVSTLHSTSFSFEANKYSKVFSGATISLIFTHSARESSDLPFSFKDNVIHLTSYSFVRQLQIAPPCSYLDLRFFLLQWLLAK